MKPIPVVQVSIFSWTETTDINHQFGFTESNGNHHLTHYDPDQLKVGLEVLVSQWIILQLIPNRCFLCWLIFRLGWVVRRYNQFLLHWKQWSLVLVGLQSILLALILVATDDLCIGSSIGSASFNNQTNTFGFSSISSNSWPVKCGFHFLLVEPISETNVCCLNPTESTNRYYWNWLDFQPHWFSIKNVR